MSRPVLIRLTLVAGFLLAWEAVRRLNIVGPLLLASPSEIVSAGVASGPKFAVAFELTFIEIVVAIALSVLLGGSVGAFAGTRPFLGAVTGPVLTSLFAVPLITWYPLFMVWFGIGPASKIAYGVVSAFFPIAINTMNGLRGVDRKYLIYGRAVGCSRMQIILTILIPLALPSIVAGLRIGASLAIIGVVVAEMLASLGGIGFIITSSRNMYATGDVYFGIVLALFCALLANLGLSLIEQRFTRWRDLQASVR
jgi:NitT/TauT family transport system permease protein/taurine transport system permease protein